VVLLVHAADQLLDSLTGSDIHILGQEAQERARMKKGAAASAVIALVLAPVAASGLPPLLAGRPGATARRLARVVVAALAVLYLALTVSAVATADAELLPYAVAAAITAGGAALAFAELRKLGPPPAY